MSGAASDVVTLLMTDVVGSTALWERHPDEMAEAIARHSAIAAEIVASCGGSLLQERGEGDSTFSVFLLATDAVNAAARLARAFAEEEWPDPARLSVRIAVYTGEAEERDGVYTGLTASRGARLRSLAFGGQVVLGASTAAVVADALPPGTALVNLGPKPLKDLSRPENVYELRIDAGLAGAPPPLDDAGASSLGWADLAAPPPFVGRDEELRAAWEAWEEAASGARVLAMVSGEAGIGKTALAAETARRVAAEGGLVLYGRWDEEPLAPYQAFRQALGDYGRACPRSILRADLRDRSAEITRLFPELADRIGLHEEPIRGGAEAERFRLFEALDGWLEAIAGRHPVLLVLDDVHWADRASLLLVEHLLRTPRPTRLLLLATLRDTDLERSELPARLPGLTRSASTRRVTMRGLEDDEVVELVRRSAGRELLDRDVELARELRRETAGNPFFLREIIRQLAEVGGLDAAASAAHLEVPPAVRDVVQWHVQRLSPRCAAALSVAAVTGHEFQADVLAAAAGVDDDDLLDVLDEADRAGLVAEAPNARYAFSHAVVRRVLLDGLSATRRARLHRRVGQALEERAGRQAPLAELAHHFGSADGAAEKAVRYARLAGDEALRELAYESAVGHFRQALEALDRVDDGEEAETMRCQLLLALGDAHGKAGEYPARDDTFVRAADVARRLDRTDLFVEAALGFGGVLPANVQADARATALLEEALDRVGPEHVRPRACLLARLAHWRHHELPRRERRALFDEALELARRIEMDDPRAVADVLIERHDLLDGPEDVAEQLVCADEVRAVAERLGDHELMLESLRIRIAAHFEAGDFAAACAVGREMRAQAERLRHPEFLRLATMWDIVVASVEGRFDEAERLADELHARLQHIGHPQAELIYVAQTCSWRWLQGRAADYLLLFSALASADPSLAYPGLGAWFHAEAGDGERTAEILSQHSTDELRAVDTDFMWWSTVVGFAGAAAAVEDADWAATIRELVLPFADHFCILGQACFLGAAGYHLGLVERVLGRLDDAVTHLEDARRRHEEMNARPWVALTQQALSEALLARGEPGDQDRAAELRKQALQTADELGLEAVRTRLQ